MQWTELTHEEWTRDLSKKKKFYTSFFRALLWRRDNHKMDIVLELHSIWNMFRFSEDDDVSWIIWINTFLSFSSCQTTTWLWWHRVLGSQYFSVLLYYNVMVTGEKQVNGFGKWLSAKKKSLKTPKRHLKIKFSYLVCVCFFSSWCCCCRRRVAA